MWYQNRDELDRISKAGVWYYLNALGNPVVRMNSSFWLECEKDDTAFTQPAINTGNWEAWNAVAVMNELYDQEKPVEFIDVGANNGYYSIMAGSAGFVVNSYEPNPILVQMILNSSYLNNLNNITVWPYAVSDVTGSRVLYTHENHSGAASLEGEGTGFNVETQILDWLYLPMEDYEKSFVIKVDVEGHERNVWNGAKDLRTSSPNVWFLEWVPVRHGVDYNREWLTEVLKTHDLQMVNYDGTLRPVGIEEALEVEFETIVFRKR